MTTRILPLIFSLLVCTRGFQLPLVSRESHLWSTSSDGLLEAVRAEPQNDTVLGPMIEKLEFLSENIPEEDENRFEPLVGLYDVSYTKTKIPGDNPVGGKWTRKNGVAQKILRTRRTFQHILPANTTKTTNPEAVGEAVNVVSLDAFWGLVRLTIILRGDAVPLSLEERTNTSRVVQPLTTRAVKALFDAPRIVFGKRGRIFNVNVGPKTSVLLDSTYVDQNLRIGMGGTSGTRFVFARCPDDDVEANEFRALLERKPAEKRKALVVLGAIASTGIYGATAKGLRVVGGVMGVASVLLGALIATSSGGIEEGDRGVQFRKEEEAKSAT